MEPLDILTDLGVFVMVGLLLSGAAYAYTGYEAAGYGAILGTFLCLYRESIMRHVPYFRRTDQPKTA